jgi:hypothetical protein
MPSGDGAGCYACRPGGLMTSIFNPRVLKGGSCGSPQREREDPVLTWHRLINSRDPMSRSSTFLGCAKLKEFWRMGEWPLP